jgi:hypothetical protein
MRDPRAVTSTPVAHPRRRARRPWRGRGGLVTAVVVALMTATAGTGLAASSTPIPDAGPTDLPVFLGAAATAVPTGSANVPQNPFLAPNPSQLHKDTWMSDTQPQSGPLGAGLRVWSTALTEIRTTTSILFICGTGGFDRYGRYETACSSPDQAALVLLDPVTLEVLASQELPTAGAGNSSSGLSTGYLYIDDMDRAVIPTVNGTLTIVPQTGGKDDPGFGAPTVYQLSEAMGGAATVFSPVPDFSGRIWVTGRESGIVGVLDPTDGSVETVRLGDGEGIYNSFPVTGNTAFIVTDRRLYRVTAGSDGVPRIEWSMKYLTDGKQKPGQISDGSGTTPTILGGGKYVAIVDNAPGQEHIVVYRTAKTLPRGLKREVCRVGIFPKGQGAVEDSLIGFRDSLVAVNNYGYTIDLTTLESTPSVPGVVRVDIRPDGRGCRTVWNNTQVTSPNAGLVLSTADGLVYAYTRKYDVKGLDVWYWTAIDFRTGKVAWERQVGTGSQFDAYWPLPIIGPNGTIYMSAYGGIVATKDMR